jgi:hypothetical protein
MSAVAAAVIGSAVVGGVVASKSAKKASNAQVEVADKTVVEQRLARDELNRLLAPYTASGIPALQSQMNLLGLGAKTTDWGAYARSNPAIMQAFEAQRNPAPTPPAAFGAGPITNFADIPAFNDMRGGEFNDIGNIGGDFMGTGQFGDRGYPAGAPMPQYGGQQAAQPMQQAPGIQSLEEFAQNYYQTTGMNAGDNLDQFTIDPQQQAISQLENSAAFQALARQGEEGILQNASATGGLRGGNVQGALAQFRPALLNQFIEQQYSRLGGLTNLGQASAAGVGAAGQNAATNIGTALTASGQAQAGNALAQGAAFNNALGTITGFGTSEAGQKAFGKLF